jgi:hypothetical protein
MWDASVWYTIDLTCDEHILYTSRPVIGYGPFEGIREQEEETDSTDSDVLCATNHNVEGPGAVSGHAKAAKS